MSNEYDNATIKGCSELIVAFALGLLICFAISVCCVGCKPQKEIVSEVIEKPVIVTQEHHTESVRVDIVRDTIHQRDSIYHYIKGDTTIIERWHYYTNNNQQLQVDTLVKVDSVQVPVEVVRTKEVTKIEKVNILHWWQKLLMSIGGLSFIAVGLFVAYKVGKKK